MPKDTKTNSFTCLLRQLMPLLESTSLGQVQLTRRQAWLRLSRVPGEVILPGLLWRCLQVVTTRLCALQAVSRRGVFV